MPLSPPGKITPRVSASPQFGQRQICRLKEGISDHLGTTFQIVLLFAQTLSERDTTKF